MHIVTAKASIMVLLGSFLTIASAHAEATNHGKLWENFNSHGGCGRSMCDSGQVGGISESSLTGDMRGECYSYADPNKRVDVTFRFRYQQNGRNGYQSFLTIPNGESLGIGTQESPPFQAVAGTKNSFSEHLRADMLSKQNQNVIVKLRQDRMERSIYAHLQVEVFGPLNDKHIMCELTP